MEKLIDFRADKFVGQFSKRALFVGRQHALNGHLLLVRVKYRKRRRTSVGSVRATAWCCRTPSKHSGYEVQVVMRGPPEYQLVCCRCACEDDTGIGDKSLCSHVCGLLFRLATLAAQYRDEAREKGERPSSATGKSVRGVPQTSESSSVTQSTTRNDVVSSVREQTGQSAPESGCGPSIDEPVSVDEPCQSHSSTLVSAADNPCPPGSFAERRARVQNFLNRMSEAGLNEDNCVMMILIECLTVEKAKTPDIRLTMMIKSLKPISFLWLSERFTNEHTNERLL